MNIFVLGAGSFGTAISMLLAQNGHQVTLWAYRKETAIELAHTRRNKKLPGFLLPGLVQVTHDLAMAQAADMIVGATPSFAVGESFKRLAPYLNEAKGPVVVNLAKGLAPGTLRRLSQVIGDHVPVGVPVAVLSGPSHAEEVAAGKPTTNVVAAPTLAVAQQVQNAFMSPTFRVYTHTDMIGVELGGALKNVIALCAGISDGLGFGDNTKAALMTRGMAEITRLGVKLGASPETFSGLSGMGDLIVTCTSPLSRNRRAGILIGQGLSLAQAQDEIGMVVEGINTCRAAKQLADQLGVDMPIVSQAYQVLFENKPARETTLALMGRSKRSEAEFLSAF